MLSVVEDPNAEKETPLNQHFYIATGSHRAERSKLAYEKLFKQAPLACSVCDRTKFPEELIYPPMLVQDVPKFYTLALRPPEYELSERLRADYNIARYIIDRRFKITFEKMLLSPRGLFGDTGRGQYIQVCRTCAAHFSMAPLAKDGTEQPPKFAIANGLYVGLFPDDVFNEVTSFEI